MEFDDLSREQQDAVRDMLQWARDGDSLVYYLTGRAGTGKTSCAKAAVCHLLGSLDGCVPASFTAKAASRMRECGLTEADTMHSVIYHVGEHSQQRLRKLRDGRELLITKLTTQEKDPYSAEQAENHPQVVKLDGLIFLEEKKLRRPRFRINEDDSPLKDAKLGLLDECSMVDDRTGQDWLSFGVKTIVLGDPGQLPPIAGEGIFTRRKANFELTQIHRQAENDPIIQIAEQFRQLGYPEPGQYGESLVVRSEDIERNKLADLMLGADRVLCYTNATRHKFNDRIRALKGRKSKFPDVGEMVMCLRNDREKGLYNGMAYRVVEIDAPVDGAMEMVVEPELGGQQVECKVHVHHFLGEEAKLKKTFGLSRKAQEFDHAVASTVHKAQGSQWDRVLLWDEARGDPEYRARWRYTAASRAVRSLTVIRP